MELLCFNITDRLFNQAATWKSLSAQRPLFVSFRRRRFGSTQQSGTDLIGTPISILLRRRFFLTKRALFRGFRAVVWVVGGKIDFLSDRTRKQLNMTDELGGCFNRVVLFPYAAVEE